MIGMDFQKQIDTITGALSLFDLSYLVSGAAMLGAVSFAYPEFGGFLFHDEHVISSLMVCVVAAYIAGLFSWVLGKRMRYLAMGIWKWDKYAVKNDLEDLLDKACSVYILGERSKIKRMMDINKSMAYSYMWMKLDKADNEDCKRRFDFISRFWTFRAMYEGLMPPVIVFAIAFYTKYSVECFCSSSCFCMALKNIDICSILYFLVVFGAAALLVIALGMEARKCFKTQLKEVVNAFCEFCPEETRNSG